MIMIMIMVIVMKRREEGIKPKRNKWKHNAVAHHLLTNAQATPDQPSVPPGQFPPVYILSMMLYGVEYPFGQFGSFVSTMLPHRLQNHRITKSQNN